MFAARGRHILVTVNMYDNKNSGRRVFGEVHYVAIQILKIQLESQYIVVKGAIKAWANIHS